MTPLADQVTAAYLALTGERYADLQLHLGAWQMGRGLQAPSWAAYLAAVMATRAGRTPTPALTDAMARANAAGEGARVGWSGRRRRGMYEHLIEKPVLVRAHLAGVYLGILLAAHPDGGLRLRGRRLWSWTGALDSTVLAADGPKGGRIGPEADVVLTSGAQVIEVLAATAEALDAVRRIEAWRA